MSIIFPQDASIQGTYTSFPYTVTNVDNYVTSNQWVNEVKNTSNVANAHRQQQEGERAAAAWQTRGGGVANAHRQRQDGERAAAAWRTRGGSGKKANARRRRSVRGRRDRCIFSSALNE